MNAPSPSNLPAVVSPTGTDLALVDSAAHYIALAKAENTRRAYSSDWAHFEAWCASHGALALPAEAETVAAYVLDHAESLKPSTLARRLNAISFRHRGAGYESPTGTAATREILKGIRNSRGARKDGKAALSVSDVRAMVESLPATLAGQRDRAIILLGFAGAFRRSEIVGLDVADLARVPEGFIVTVRRSKTDQGGLGHEVGIARGNATCPVREVEAWLDASGIKDGPLFRPIDRHGNMRAARLSGYAVALIVHRAAAAAHLTPAAGEAFGAHSLRAGHATAAARAGVEERSIMRQGRWRSESTVRGYIRHGSLFTENSSARLGL